MILSGHSRSEGMDEWVLSQYSPPRCGTSALPTPMPLSPEWFRILSLEKGRVGHSDQSQHSGHSNNPGLMAPEKPKVPPFRGVSCSAAVPSTDRAVPLHEPFSYPSYVVLGGRGTVAPRSLGGTKPVKPFPAVGTYDLNLHKFRIDWHPYQKEDIRTSQGRKILPLKLFPGKSLHPASGISEVSNNAGRLQTQINYR